MVPVEVGDWATAEILLAYASQERVEDLFRTMKDSGHFSMRPQWHLMGDKILMRVFMCQCSPRC